MAPHAYTDTYRAYKEGTKQITTWPVQAAQRCGADLSFLGQSPAPINARKSKTKAKNQAKSAYEIPLCEFRRLVKYIAKSTSPKIRLPSTIAELIRRVISLRQQATNFFRKLSSTNYSPSVRDANDGHQYFIDVLQETLDILQSSPKPESNDDSLGISNMFEALTVEETVEGDLASPQPLLSETKPPNQTTQSEYELVITPTDRAFAIFTFFQDMNDTRDHIQSVWHDYKDGRLDAMSAAVTIDTAFSLLKKSCEELSQTQSFYGCTEMLLAVLGHTYGPPANVKDWFCGTSHGLLISYANVLQTSYLPVMKQGYLGVYDPTYDRAMLSDKEREHEDLIILTTLLPEFTKLSRADIEFPVDDLLTTGLRPMMDASSIASLPTYAIFATQILLDIHHVLREHVSRPFNQLQATARRIINTLDDHFRYHRDRKTKNWCPENDAILRRQYECANDWVLEDQVGKCINMGVKGAESPPFHLLKNHPILAGVLMFRLNMRLHEAGINLCSAWGSAIYPIHLYNAARSSAGLEEEWVDAEYILSVHSPARIFVGARPGDLQEYFKRFHLAMGGSASNFAPHRKPGNGKGIDLSKKGPRGLKTTSPIKDIFNDRYVQAGGPAVMSVPNIVAMIAVATKAERVRPSSVDLTRFAREMVTKKQFSNIELLRAVREGMAGEELHILFDYFSLHQRGLNLLRGLQTNLDAKFVKYIGLGYIEDESQLVHLVGYIFEIARGSNFIAQHLTGVKTTSRILLEATAVLSKMLQGGNGITLKMKAKKSADAVL